MPKTSTKERRRNPRRKFSLPVQLVTRGALEPIPFRTLDISNEGVFISTETPLPVSTEVTLVFFLKNLGANVRASGKVVRSCTHPSDPAESEGMAIEISEHTKLEWHLLRNMLETADGESETGA